MASKMKQSKAQLEASAKKYQDALEDDLDDVISQAKSILAGAVVIGAGFWIAYSIFKAFSKEHSEEPTTLEVESHHAEPSTLSVIKKALMKELAIFLLGIIKEKMFEYIKEVKSEENDSE